MITERSDSDTKAARKAQPMQAAKKSTWGFWNANTFGGAEAPPSSNHQQQQWNQKGSGSNSSSGSSSLSSSWTTDNPPPRPPKPGSSNQSWNYSSRDHHQWSGGYGEKRPKRCNDFFSCPVANISSFSDHDKHVSKYVHACRYGISCREKNNPRHGSMYYHFDKPYCKYGKDCREMDNPQHRAKYHHPGFWDWLEPCKNGSNCLQRYDRAHCLKYMHDGKPVYPEEKP